MNAPDWLDDIDTVSGCFKQARAVIELIQLADPKHDIVGTGLLTDACDAADELLRRGADAFKRMEARRIAVR
jgi:hypothetical protein